jgi:hypothetical protein
MSTTASRVRVAVLDATYLVAEGHPSPERLARHLDDVVRMELPAALRTTLMPLLKPNDPTLWFIRRLDVPVDVNGAWEPDAIARSWAREISRTLVQDLSGAGDGSNVIRFPDRAAYLARFVVDAATGDAFSHWVYRSFAGLRALPVSAAIRTALADDLALGLAALRRLDLRELGTVVAALTEADARRTLNFIAGGREEASLDASLAAAVAAWPAIAASCDALSVPRSALALFVRAAGAGGPAARAAAEAVAALAAIVRTSSASASSRLRRALAAGDVGLARELAGTAPPALGIFAQLPHRQVDAAFRAVAPASAGEHAGVETRHTRFGGALLLLPLLDALKCDAVAADWPTLGATRAAQLLRWLVLVKCLGRPRADAAFHDPALRDVFGIAPQIGWPQTAAWLGALGQVRRRDLARAFRPGAPHGTGAAADLDYLALPRTTGIDPIWQRALTFGARQVMQGFAARLPGFGQSRYDYLHRNFLDFAATLEYEPARIVVRLGRPPLHLMLGLTGASRGTMRFDWLDARPLALFSEE